MASTRDGRGRSGSDVWYLRAKQFDYHRTMHVIPDKAATAANRLRLDYRREAERLGTPVVPIIDIHSHINGPRASKVYDEARRLYGVRRVYSMNQLPSVGPVREVLGDAVRFIAFPQFIDPDRSRSHREGFLEAIEKFHREHGSRMLKLWNAPALQDVLKSAGGATDLREVDSPWRVKACELGERLGMMYMIHLADPDTWFKTKYTDSSVYGVKRELYHGLERMLDRFTAPWIAAHMGGWPEDLVFLDGLLTRHPNLHLDTSATRWVVRELGRQPRDHVRTFFRKWTGRILFGSDLVVMDDQLTKEKTAGSPRGELASSPEEALELYCSRYWALRTMFETDYDGESNIADPDLKMMEPERYDEMAGPRMQGLALPPEDLRVLYAGAAERVVEAWWSAHGGW